MGAATGVHGRAQESATMNDKAAKPTKQAAAKAPPRPAKTATTRKAPKPAAKPATKPARKPAAKSVRQPVQRAATTAKAQAAPVEELDREEKGVKAGRPSLYDPIFAKTAELVCGVAGLTDEDLAREFDVSVRTINRWKQAHPEFREALMLGKQRADNRVVNALFNNAVGFRYEALDIRTVGVGKGLSDIVQTPHEKFVEPDTFAQQYWLNNRRPDQWKAKVEVTVEATAMDVETANARFFERMQQSLARQAAVKAEREALGMTGD